MIYSDDTGPMKMIMMTGIKEFNNLILRIQNTRHDNRLKLNENVAILRKFLKKEASFLY